MASSCATNIAASTPLMRRPRFGPTRAGIVTQALFFFLGEAFTSFRRNGLMSIAAVTTVLVTLLMLGGAFLAGTNLAALAQTLDAQVEIVAFLADGLPGVDRGRLQRTIETLPNVAAVRFVGRAEALTRLQARLGGAMSFADLGETNPLPDSFEIRVIDARSTEQVAKAIGRLSGVAEVSSGGKVLERLMALTRGVRVAAFGVVGLLGGVAIIIVLNTIRLTVLARRREIEIMELVGATRWLIRWPFLFEGMLNGAIAAVVASGILVTVYPILIGRLAESLPFLPTVPLLQVLPQLLTFVVMLGIALGASGSALAVRRFLKS